MTTSSPTSLAFTEEMKGFVGVGATDFEDGHAQGRSDGTRFMFHLTIDVDDVDAFVADATHEAHASGWVECDALGGRLAVERGIFNLFVETGVARRSRMLYRLYFEAADGRPLTMTGFKLVGDDPGLDLWPDTTTLYVRLLAGHVPPGGDDGAEVVGAGQIHIYLLDFARQLTTFRVRGPSAAERARALALFGRLFMGRLWDTYAPPARAARRELRHETIIDAPVEQVWRTFTDTDAWPQWNPTLPSAGGPLLVGTTVRMRLRLGPLLLPVRQQVRVVEEPRLIRWTTVSVPSLFEVDRTFEMWPLAGDRTHFAQYETGSTWLAAKVVPMLERPIEDGYEALAEALRTRLAAPGAAS